MSTQSNSEIIITCRDLTKTYKMGDMIVHAL